VNKINNIAGVRPVFGLVHQS